MADSIARQILRDLSRECRNSELRADDKDFISRLDATFSEQQAQIHTLRTRVAELERQRDAANIDPKARDLGSMLYSFLLAPTLDKLLKISAGMYDWLLEKGV